MWLALSVDGILREFDSPDHPIANHSLSVPGEVTRIKLGRECDTQAPPGLGAEQLMRLCAHKEQSWTLCCDSVDEALAWQLALEQARVFQQQQPPRRGNVPPVPAYLEETFASAPHGTYPMYYGGGSYSGAYPSRVVFDTRGQPITVVYVPQQPYYYDRYYGGGGMGLLGGAALASMFMWPLFWPMCW